MQARNVGLGSAIVASACCVGPALLAFLGLASFGGGYLSRYHWYFLAVGLVGVSLAWLQFGRERRKLHALAAQMRNERVTRGILLFATVVIVAVAALNAYPALARRAISNAATLPVQASSQIVLPVSGMDCALCAVPIKARLKELRGVGDVDVDVAKGTVSVNYDPAKVKPEQLVAAISSTGYKATLPKQ
jgi:copper chaperone CopZ